MCAVVFAICAPWLGRRLRVDRFVAWFYVTTLGGFLALTATPTRSALEGHQQGATYLSFDVVLPRVQELSSANDVSLNIVAGVALGLSDAALGLARGSFLPLLGVTVAPVTVEVIQWTVPALGRSGFLLPDVVQNWAGLIAGAGLVGAAATLVPGRRAGVDRHHHRDVQRWPGPRPTRAFAAAPAGVMSR